MIMRLAGSPPPILRQTREMTAVLLFESCALEQAGRTARNVDDVDRLTYVVNVARLINFDIIAVLA